jgi:hypothetical protein
MTDSTEPDRSQGTPSRRRAIDPALREELRERVLAPETRRQAGRQGKATHGAPGGEGMTIEDFPALAREQWASSRDALREGTYQPSPPRAAHGDSQASGEGDAVARDSHRRGADYPASECARVGTAL